MRVVYGVVVETKDIRGFDATVLTYCGSKPAVFFDEIDAQYWADELEAKHPHVTYSVIEMEVQQ